MKNELIVANVWERLTTAAKTAKKPAFVAVAYLGHEASKMIPLPKGSYLVVDASINAVKSGLTCPNDLLDFVKRGISVFSVSNLHAKVFVFGNKTYIGSTNVSRNSENNLVEAVLSSTDKKIVSKSRRFIKSLCQDPLSPEYLEQLQRQYKEIKFVSDIIHSKSKVKNKIKPIFSPIRIVQLHRVVWTEDEERIHTQGKVEARKKAKHSGKWEIESFKYYKPSFKFGEKIFPIMKEDDGRKMACPPGNFVHQVNYKGKRGKPSFIYYERQKNKRRRELKSFSKRIGKGIYNLLDKNCKVTDQNLINSLLSAWQMGDKEK